MLITGSSLKTLNLKSISLLKNTFHVLHRLSLFKVFTPYQWRRKGHIFGARGGKEGCGQRKRRTKECGEDEKDQKENEAWRVTTDFTPVMTNVEVPYDVKEDRARGLRGRSHYLSYKKELSERFHINLF